MAGGAPARGTADEHHPALLGRGLAVVGGVDGRGMAALSFAAAVARLKADENKEVAALVLRDRPLQAVIACWPMVRRSVAPGEVTEDAALEDLWAAVSFDEREVVELSGCPAGLALAALRRARGNRLIYPDGSVHSIAKVVLQRMIKDAVQGRSAGK